MTKPGRIPCINQRCKRTAPADKYRPGTEIICGKCFKALPAEIKANIDQAHPIASPDTPSHS